MIFFGLTTFILAFIALVGACLPAVNGLRRKQTSLPPISTLLGKLSFGLNTLSLLSLLYLLITEDYSLAYVNAVINPTLTTTLRITALWGGQAGSLFFWTWILNLCLFIALLLHRRKLDAWSFLVIAANVLLFASINLFSDNPFNRIWLLTDNTLTSSLFSPAAGAQIYSMLTGVGLNPLLRHPGMIIHPPILYLGMALFLVPFAVAVSQLIRSDFKDGFMDQIRGWSLSAWIFLTAGVVLGSWWSYDVLGWGGYWAWDPVETASLLPWFTATALIHSLLMQIKRGIFRRFNLVLILLTFLLIAFSIFTTRSGIISSVHAFGESNIIYPLLAHMLGWFLLSAALLAWRWKQLGSQWEIGSLFSREAFFLYTNVILLGLMLVCLWGLLFPLISNLFTGTQITFDRGFYDRSTLPLFILLVLLMGICPLVGWTAASVTRLGKKIGVPLLLSVVVVLLSAFVGGIQSWIALLVISIVTLGLAALVSLTLRDAFAAGFGKFPRLWWAQRARYGAWFVHAGILLIALGIVGVETLSTSIEGTMLPGERMPLGNYEIEFVDINTSFDTPEYLNLSVHAILYKNGVKLQELTPGQHIYMDRQLYTTIPAVHSTLRGDVYAILLGHDRSIPYATIRLMDNPLVNFMWIGGGLLVAGGALALTVSHGNGQEEEEALDS